MPETVVLGADALSHGLPMPQVAAERLFAGASRIAILHAGETYLLTLTRQNKLLLTKQV
ncbi:MAG TPA: hemin uptake protein HemP [Methylophilus sp.]